MQAFAALPIPLPPAWDTEWAEAAFDTPTDEEEPIATMLFSKAHIRIANTA